MPITQQLAFLQEKIHAIGSAIFFNLSDSVLKLPTSLISTLRVDDYGFIWFYVQKPRQNLKEFEAEFPVRLDFFKKGINCFLQISGKGWVVSDPEEIYALSLWTDSLRPSDNEGSVLVKVKMLRAEYSEVKLPDQKPWWQPISHVFSMLFGHSNQFRPGTYFPAS